MDIKGELIRGLTSTPKYIPPWFRYDKEGSVYNDLCLTENHHYYLHRSELNILNEHINDMVEEAPDSCVLVDFGSGNSVKTRYFIDALLKKRETLTYIPVDISTEFIKEVCDSLQLSYGARLTITPIYGDYHTAIDSFREIKDDKLIVWFGSMQSLCRDEQIEILLRLSENMNDKDRLLISLDITQDVEAVYNAYFDNMGHADRLYTNAVRRLTREYGADLDLTKFKLIGTFQRTLNPDEVSKFTVGWRSIGEQDINIPGLNLSVHFTDGEFLNLYEKDGTSCKYTMDQIRNIVHKGNHVLYEHWIDNDRHAVFCCLGKKQRNIFQRRGFFWNNLIKKANFAFK